MTMPASPQCVGKLYLEELMWTQDLITPPSHFPFWVLVFASENVKSFGGVIAYFYKENWYLEWQPVVDIKCNVHFAPLASCLNKALQKLLIQHPNFVLHILCAVQGVHPDDRRERQALI
jgi:hypothetical protein